MKLTAVLFDFGDTLILSDRLDYDHCLLQLLDSLKTDEVAIPDSFEEFKRVYFEVRSLMYGEAEETLKEVDFPERIAETLRHFGYRFSTKDPVLIQAVDAFFDAFAEDMRIEDYVPSLLEQLKQKYKLGLVSNFSYPKGLHKALERFNLVRFFEAIVVSGEFGLRKPSSEIFQRALSLLNVKASEAAFVGDSLKTDIDGARKVGIKTILVENVGLRKNPFVTPGELDFVAVQPDRTIPNLEELAEVLEDMQVRPN